MVRSLLWLLLCWCYLGAVAATDETFQGKAEPDEFSKYKIEEYDDNSEEKSDDKNDDSSEDFYDYNDYGDEEDYDSFAKGKFIKKYKKTYMNAPAQSQPTVVCWLGIEFIPHPNDCNQFYHCAHGRPFLKKCSLGLYFNPKLNVCDWPHAVDCGSSTRNRYNRNSYPRLYHGPTYNDYEQSFDNGKNNDVTEKRYYNNGYNNHKDFNYKTNIYDNNKEDYLDDEGNDNNNDYSSEEEEYDDEDDKQYNNYKPTIYKQIRKIYNNPQKRVFDYYPKQEPQPKQINNNYNNKPNYRKPKNFGPGTFFLAYPPPGPAYFRPPGIFNTPFWNPPMMNSMSQQPPMMTHNDYRLQAQHPMQTPVQPQQPPKQVQQPEEKQVTYYYYDDDSQPTQTQEKVYYYYDNGAKRTPANKNGFWIKKKAIQGGALTNPGYFGEAFKVLQSDRNLMNQPAKYIHHDHTGGPMTGHGSGSGVDGDELVKLLLLGTPQGSQLLITSKLLSAVGNGKSKKKGSDSLLKTIFLLNLLNNNNNNNNAAPQLTPNVQLDANNQLVAIATNLPVTLVNPVTGQEVDVADAQVDQLTGQLTDATGQPLGVLNPLTGELVPAVVQLPGAQARRAPVTLPRRAASTRRTGSRGASVLPLVPRSSSLTSAVGDGINLVFLSPLTPSSLPPPLNSNSRSATYIRGTLQELLGEDLSRYLTTRSLKANKAVNSAASSSSATCSVIRSGESVTMRLNPQNGRRLSSKECTAMGNLLDKFLPIFLQNFVPADIAASGLGRKQTNTDNNINTNSNNNNGNGNAADSLNGLRNIFGRAESQRQSMPSLVPPQFNNNNNNNNDNNNNNNNIDIDVFRGIGGNGNNINDFISVRNELNGCTISVPSIVTQC